MQERFYSDRQKVLQYKTKAPCTVSQFDDKSNYSLPGQPFFYTLTVIHSLLHFCNLNVTMRMPIKKKNKKNPHLTKDPSM